MGVLREFVAVLGVPGFLILFAIVVVAILATFYMVLHFGEVSLSSLGSFAMQFLEVLRRERKNAHPAIRLEFGLHIIFLAVFLLSFGLMALHALIPWSKPATERAVSASLVSSFTMLVFLSCISVKWADRL
jgi:hypothetical protein